MTPRTRTERWTVAGVAAALAAGVGLRSWQWLAGTSLWIDELGIARNVRDRGLGELLFQPLDHQQMAPPGFLAAVEGVTSAAGLDELALRLVPWLMAVAGLLLLWRVARRFLSGAPLVGAVALAAVSPALLWYGGNLKQYAGDVAITLLVVLLALRHLERPGDLRRAVVAGLLGGLALLMSHPAVMVAALSGALLAAHWLRSDPRPSPAPLAALGTGWAAGSALAAGAALSFTTPELRAYMRDWWAEGFAPWSDGILAVAGWIPERLFHVLAHHLVMVDEVYWPLAVPAAILALPGAVYLLRRDRWRAALLLAPPAAALLGGLLHLFPVRHRNAVYAGSTLLVVAMAGVRFLLDRPERTSRAAGGVLLFLAVAPLTAAVVLNRPPYRMQETRPVLAELAERARPDDLIYVYCKAADAADFYGPEVGLGEWRRGGCHQDAAGYVDEVESLRGEPRVWFVFTQWTPEAPYPDTMKAVFRRMGREVDRIPDPYGGTGQAEAAAHLYDLSRPASGSGEP